MKKIAMACTAAALMLFASCTNSTTCYTCTYKQNALLVGTICDGKVTYSSVPVGLTTPTVPSGLITNDAIKLILETGGFTCVAK